jgi:hypothetical protein
VLRCVNYVPERSTDALPYRSNDLRPLNIAKLSSLDFYVCVPLDSFGSYFTADVLSLTVTISPDKKGSRISCIIGDVGRDRLLVL